MPFKKGRANEVVGRIDSALDERRRPDIDCIGIDGRVTYAGVDRLVSKFQHAIQESVTGAPQAMLQLFYISGGGTVLNILFGAIAFILSFKQMTKLATSIGKKK